MQITRLKLQDFRCHEALDVTGLRRLNYVIGPNAAGKSSIQQAIEFAFTGRCSATDAAGRGSDDLVRIGQKEAIVQMAIEPLGFLGRRFGGRSHAVAVGGPDHPLPIKDAQSAIERGLGVSTPVLSAVLNCWRFQQMSESEQRTLLTQALAAQPVRLPDDVAADWNEAIGASPLEVGSADELAHYHKQAFDLRTGINRQIREMGADEEAPAPPSSRTSAQLDKALADAQRDLRSLEGQRAEREGAYQRLVDRRAALQRTIEEAKAECLPEAEQKRLMGIRVQQAAREQLQEDLAAALETVDRLRRPADALGADDARRVIEGQIAVLQDAISRADAQADRLAKMNTGVCPTCSRSLSRNLKAEITAKARETAERLGKEVEAERGRLAALDLPADASQELAQAEREVAELRGKLEFLTDVPEAIAKLDASRKAYVRANKAQKELDALPQMDAPNTADVDEAIAQAEKTASDIREVLTQQRVWEEQARAQQRRAAERAKLQTRSASLDRLVDALGPKGSIAQQLVGDRLQPFADAMNDSLRQFGYEVSVSLEPYKLLVRREGGTPLKLRLLSRSEQFRFGIAFQVALAQVTGVRFVLIDEADVLDEEQRTLLRPMLMDADIDQAIVMATGTHVPDREPEGVRFIPIGIAEQVAA